MAILLKLLIFDVMANYDMAPMYPQKVDTMEQICKFMDQMLIALMISG